MPCHASLMVAIDGGGSAANCPRWQCDAEWENGLDMAEEVEEGYRSELGTPIEL